MARTVFCEYLKKRSGRLRFPTLSRRVGEAYFDSVSKQAWGEWIKKQTMLVNEKKT